MVTSEGASSGGASHVGDGIEAENGAWTFGSATPAAFDGHVVRSVPFYEACHELVVDLADHLVRRGGRCYDLGCSTGSLTQRLAIRLAPRGAEVIGVDRESGMVALAAERCGGRARFQTQALENLQLEPADLLVAFYTLQFVPLPSRQQVVDKLRASLGPGGALILFEKVLSSSARGQAISAEIYRDWKLRQGFTQR